MRPAAKLQSVPAAPAIVRPSVIKRSLKVERVATALGAEISNVNLAESNLDRMDPNELVAAVSGNGTTGSTSAPDVLPDAAQELAQRVWWYLLVAGILLLIAETVLAQRLSRAAR